MAFKIESLTAFVAIDENGDEGILGFKGQNNTWLPLICADEERVKQMYPIAEAITRSSKKPFRVVQFLVRVDITEDVVKKFGQ
jgi:hypothetical protein